MRTAPDDDLDLPPLDGSIGDGEPEDGEAEGHHDEDVEDARELGDAFDDSTSEGDPLDEIAVEGTEAGWLVDSEDSPTLDVGAFDVAITPEGKILDEEEPEVRHGADEELGAHEEAIHTDGGEEGPLAEDEELREEDLPALDADDDGDVADDTLFERGAMDTEEELRWDDRAWARAPAPAPASEQADESDDSGMLAGPGDEPRLAARDATWKRLEESGRVTAVAIVPGESVVVAMDGPERPVLVRVLTDGMARIIAEIDNSATEDDGSACRVTSLRWDAGRGCLVATGTFGVQAFRPA